MTAAGNLFCLSVNKCFALFPPGRSRQRICNNSNIKRMQCIHWAACSLLSGLYIGSFDDEESKAKESGKEVLLIRIAGL
jgi:hypothetical protein